MSVASSVKPERGGCLTAWIVVALIANALLAFYYLTSSAAMQAVYPSAPGWAFIGLAALGVINAVGAIGLWMWKRWGFYVYAGVAAITLVVNLIIGVPITYALTGLIGLGILWWLVKDKWAAFA
jgi:hypothetical protein